MSKDKFAAFILSHGRPDNVMTYKHLLKHNYTGEIYFIVDNEDKTVDKYIENFGKDRVKIFDKAAVAKTFDEADNFDDRRSVVYARNACFQIAKDLGIRYFIQLDDDYMDFRYRFDDKLNYAYLPCANLDRIFEIMLEFYKNTKVKSVAMAQGGDFIGGAEGSWAQAPKMKRKCMNTFILSTDDDRQFKFLGRINEDVNTYTRLASTGAMFLTLNNVSMAQVQTQSNEGGMTDIYLDSGTYVKSFYTVIFMPSSVCVRLMTGAKNPRLHHRINWRKTVPMLLSERHKKK